jgi:hypothetical protein
MTVESLCSAASRSLAPFARKRAAIVLLTALLAGPALTLPASAMSGLPPYQLDLSHVVWHKDCVAKRVGAVSAPAYRVYQSHVEWRDDQLARSNHGSAGQDWELFRSHVDHAHACSLHPIVMGRTEPTSYSWSEIVRFFSAS